MSRSDSEPSVRRGNGVQGSADPGEPANLMEPQTRPAGQGDSPLIDSFQRRHKLGPYREAAHPASPEDSFSVRVRLKAVRRVQRGCGERLAWWTEARCSEKHLCGPCRRSRALQVTALGEAVLSEYPDLERETHG